FRVPVGLALDSRAGASRGGMAGLVRPEPLFVVGQRTRDAPARAPAGKHVLWVMVRAVPAVIRGDLAGTIRGPDWTPAVKEAFANRVLAVLESHAPGLRGKILGRAVHSPTDLERLNPNLAGGDLNAGSQHLSQFYG